jgi:rhodanese-related sulfurtransferase
MFFGRATPLATTKEMPMLPAALPHDTREIDVSELERRLAAPQPPIVAEILPPESFASGHLPGAINLPLQGFASAAAALLPDKSSEIVVYCSGPTCQNSHLAERQLTSLGYQRVRVFSGGKAAWKAAGHSLSA